MRPQYRIALAILYALLFAATGWASDFDCHNVEVCPPQYDPCRCANVTPLYLGAPAHATIGAAFTGVGGRPPYTFSMTGGTINSQSGIIQSFECTGPNDAQIIGTISVTDSCKQTVTRQINIPMGHWVSKGPTKRDNLCCGAVATKRYETCFVGEREYHTVTYGLVNNSNTACDGSFSAPCGSGPPDASGYGSWTKFTTCGYLSYEWVCP